MTAEIPFEDIPKEVKPAIETTKNYFDGLYNDIARGWADTISGFVSGTIKLENIFNELWADLRDSFFRIIGEMTAGWIVDKFKSLFSAIGNAAGSGIDKVTQSLGGTAGSVAGGIASGLLGTVSAIANIVTAVASVAALFKGPEKSTDVTFWLKLIYENLGVEIMRKFDGLKASVDLSRDTANPLLAQIRDAVKWLWKPTQAIENYTSVLKNIQFGASGLDRVVNKPTLFMAGERQPERVTISPTFRFAAAPIIINLDGRQVAMAVARYSPQMSRDGILKIHNNALIGR